MTGWLNYRIAMEYAVEIIKNGEEVELPAEAEKWKCWKLGNTVVVIWEEPNSSLDEVDFSKAFPEGNEMWGDTAAALAHDCRYLADTVGWEIDESLYREGEFERGAKPTSFKRGM